MNHAQQHQMQDFSVSIRGYLPSLRERVKVQTSAKRAYYTAAQSGVDPQVTEARRQELFDAMERVDAVVRQVVTLMDDAIALGFTLTPCLADGGSLTVRTMGMVQDQRCLRYSSVRNATFCPGIVDLAALVHIGIEMEDQSNDT